MAYTSLKEFVDLLETKGELITIDKFVDPVLEIAEITDRISKQPQGGKAILFTNTGTSFPVITNMMGSMRRICLALGVDELDEFGELMRVIVDGMLQPKESLWSKLAVLPELSKIAGWLPKVQSGRGECQQVVYNNPDLSILPILKCWPLDGGRFITLPMVHTRDIETGSRNVGMYRMQVLGSQLTGMHWHKHKTGAKHLEGYRARGELMPIAVSIGGDPVYSYASTAPMPDGMDEYMLAGFMRGEKVKLVRCITVDMEVPADVDFVIEGYVDPAESPVLEGPFGDHTGFYSLADWYPSFHVTCITHRRNAIYPATLVGVPPMEDVYMAKATERIFIEPIRMAMLPELCNMVMPMEGVAHNITLVSLQSSYAGQAYKAMNTLWGAGQMMFNKFLVALPCATDLNDYLTLTKQMVRCVDPERDFFFGRGVADVLDHATDECGVGSKLFIDATSDEQFDVEPASVLHIKETTLRNSVVLDVNVSLIDSGVPVVFVAVRAGGGTLNLMEQLCNEPAMKPVIALVAVDYGVPVDNMSLLVWYASANIDPRRDTKLCHVEGCPRAKIIFDGTRKKYPGSTFKREWPNVAVMDDATIGKVDSLWSNLGIGEFIPSPSKKLKQLVQGSTSAATFEF